MVMLMKNIFRIGSFIERINIGLVSLVGCAFNEVHGVMVKIMIFVIIAGNQVPFESV